jgi:hypothetical protein
MISQIPLLVPKVNLALVLENFLFIAAWIFTHVCFWNFPGATTEKWCRMWQLCPLLYKFVCARCSRELSHGGLPLFCRFFLLLARLLNEASIVCFRDWVLFALNCRWKTIGSVLKDWSTSARNLNPLKAISFSSTGSNINIIIPVAYNSDCLYYSWLYDEIRGRQWLVNYARGVYIASSALGS